MPSIIYEKTIDEFRDIIQVSKTMSEALTRCGLRPVGSNRMTLLTRALNDGVDVSHLSNNISRYHKKRKLSEILVSNSPNTSTYNLKHRLLSKKLLNNVCSLCGQEPIWKGQPLILHLDHINGDSSDNRIENLRIICPHCDSQLPTYKGRNKYRKPQSDKTICSCGRVKFHTSQQCKICAEKSRVRPTKIEWPSYKDLMVLVNSMPMTQVAKKLGVSDNAIRKHLRNH